MAKQALLPDRCVKCNAPANHTLTRNFRWHHPAIYLLIFSGFLLYLILALVLTKRATITVGLCETHAAARKREIFTAWMLVLLSFVSFFLAAALDETSSSFVGLLLFVGGIIYGVVKARVVVAQKIDDHYVWLKGLNADYLEQFPEWRTR
jgi:hypothetical protein